MADSSTLKGHLASGPQKTKNKKRKEQVLEMWDVASSACLLEMALSLWKADGLSSKSIFFGFHPSTIHSPPSPSQLRTRTVTAHFKSLQRATDDIHIYSTMAPNQWDSEHDKNLLLLLLGFDIEISRTRFDEVATKMTNNVSGNACRYVF